MGGGWEAVRVNHETREVHEDCERLVERWVTRQLSNSWWTIHQWKIRAVSRAFMPPETGKIAVKVINHYGDDVMKVFGVGR